MSESDLLATVLRDDNTTLRKVSLNGSPRLVGSTWASRVDYFADLNYFGRGKLRGHTVPLQQFISVLAGVEVQAKVLQNAQSVSLLYTLLHECVAIWSAGAAFYGS